jgi:hypothetical protein
MLHHWLTRLSPDIPPIIFASDVARYDMCRETQQNAAVGTLSSLFPSLQSSHRKDWGNYRQYISIFGLETGCGYVAIGCAAGREFSAV